MEYYSILSFLKQKKQQNLAYVSFCKRGICAIAPTRMSLWETPSRSSYFFFSIIGVQSIMILPQVHLRKPCYDFYFL